MNRARTADAAEGSPNPDTSVDPASLRHLVRHQVLGLASVFLLGMAVSLIGLPSKTRGTAHIASLIFLAAHVVIAVGLIAGTVMVLRAATRLGSRRRRQSIAAASAIGVAVAAGILTLSAGSNWWSYLMAVGFVTALLANVGLLLPETGPGSDTRHRGTRAHQ
jgi:hypothetical protein